jgi:hypothetical protein
MVRPAILVFAAVAAVAVGAALYWQSWGLAAFIAVSAAGYAWYRIQVERSAAAEEFFGDVGEETRLTGFQGGSPSEMPPPGPSASSDRKPH